MDDEILTPDNQEPINTDHQAPESEVPEIEGQATEESTDDAAPLEEYEEIEFSGKKYNLPKELKSAFLMQSDYTRKTQEVAEQRKAIEAEREAFSRQIESQQRQSKLAAKINYLDEQIGEYSQADWNELHAHDPAKAQQLFMHYSQLKDQKVAAEREYNENEQKHQYEHQTMLSQKIQTEQAILARDIKDWSPAKAQQLSEFAVNKLGFHPNDVAQVYDAKIVKLLNMAYMADQMINKAAAPKAKVVDIKETPTVSTKAANAGTKDPSKMSDAEFARWRKAQIKAR